MIPVQLEGLRTMLSGMQRLILLNLSHTIATTARGLTTPANTILKMVELELKLLTLFRLTISTSFWQLLFNSLSVLE